MTEPFIARREDRWEYVSQTVDHIEKHNCVLGCKRGLADAGFEFGPGGWCSILAFVTCEEPVTEIWDDGAILHCTAREPLE